VGATRPQIHVHIHKAFEMENHYLEGNYDSFWTFETNNKQSEALHG
jgi:hypothetical protein